MSRTCSCKPRRIDCHHRGYRRPVTRARRRDFGASRRADYRRFRGALLLRARVRGRERSLRPTAGGPGSPSCRTTALLAARSSSVASPSHRRRRVDDRGRGQGRAARGGRWQRLVLRLALLQPREQRRGDEDRRVRTDEQADGEREGEVLERGRARGCRSRRSAATSTGSSATSVVVSDRISTWFSDRFTISP